MSDGKTHAAANMAVLALTVVVAPVTLPTLFATGAIVGAVLGTITTPDIDLPGTTHEENRIYRRFGFVGGGLWQLFWNHYAQTHSHRGSSHKPFFGTLGRWWYVLKRLWWLLAILLYYHGSFVMAYPIDCLSVIYMAFLFNALQDIVHLILDGWRFHSGR